MTVRSFLDTNILVYADDFGSGEKRTKAFTLIEDLRQQRNSVISTQVLQEYFSATTRKLKMKPNIARQKIEIFAHMDVIQVDYPLILNAIDLHQLHSLSFWDALIVQAALASQCRVVYSEDMQNGARIRGLEIVNPFA